MDTALAPRLLTQHIAPGVVERLDVLAALDTLSPRQRTCVVLHFYENRSVPEIAM